MVVGFVGGLGEGKSYSAVLWVARLGRQALKAGSEVTLYSNLDVRLPGVRCVRFAGPEDFMNMRDGLVLVDEANLVLSSRAWDRVPAQVLMGLASVRKHRLDMLWTAHSVARVDRVLREVTTEVYSVRNMIRIGLVRWVRWELDERGDEFTRKAGSGWWRFDRAVAGAYDTYADVAASAYLRARRR